ncbi:MAG: hypothetical protein VX777_07605 [Chlamydiota bacterium]|nr:hypothetical protein [Chlamydiota bacterium]
MITFVTHYVSLKPDVVKTINRARAQYTGSMFFVIESPNAIITAMYKAIKKFHPNAKLIVLTDKDTEFDLDPAIKIVRIPMKTQEIDFEAFKAKILFLKKYPVKGHVIFMEWDLLVQSNLEHIFESDRDIFFTFRNLLPMPINDGFIAINKNGISNAIKLLSIILNRYKNFVSTKFRYWYGLQLILKEIFLPLFFKINPRKVHHMRLNFQGVKVGFLHGKTYNYNPIVQSIDEFLPQHKVIHFSKHKKVNIIPYWKKFLEPMKVN